MTIFNLYIINDFATSGYKYQFLFFIYLVTTLSGILVITSKNPIVSVLFLIVLFLSISFYLMLLGMNFIGLSYLLVYVGAVSILFLFILMLINVRISELVSVTSNSIPLAIIVSIAFNSPINFIFPDNVASSYDYNLKIRNVSNDVIRSFSENLKKITDLFNAENDVFFVTSKSWDGNLAENTHISSIGNLMYSSHSIWLIITSIILLLAMVGVIVITIKR